MEGSVLITLPITVIDLNGSKDVFNNLTEAEASVEAADVASNEYRAFDAKGKELKFLVEEKIESTVFGLIRYKIDVVRLVEF